MKSLKTPVEKGFWQLETLSSEITKTIQRYLLRMSIADHLKMCRFFGLMNKTVPVMFWLTP